MTCPYAVEIDGRVMCADVDGGRCLAEAGLKCGMEVKARMTYADRIKRSVQKINVQSDEEIELFKAAFPDEESPHSEPMYTVEFHTFCESLCHIYIHVVRGIIERNKGDVDAILSDLAKPEAMIPEIRFGLFVEWLLDEEAPESDPDREEIDGFWCDLNNIVKMYNEYCDQLKPVIGGCKKDEKRRKRRNGQTD